MMIYVTKPYFPHSFGVSVSTCLSLSYSAQFSYPILILIKEEGLCD